ncbi:hypothetical protein OUZ56_006260 [Daphnia magna]|uniref:Uncharacterized protein n=1 Tax=Daphnia magna TaxID=35525 RepID=A0ABQ9YVA9_9CRUS|nr:hypothetical protein OUZ56_006260 [Daphnia magna]
MWIQPLANRLLIDRVTGLGYVDLGSHTWNSERNSCDLWDMKFQNSAYVQLTEHNKTRGNEA